MPKGKTKGKRWAVKATEPEHRVIAPPGQTQRFILLLMGPPGSGKTSVGLELEKSFGFLHISGGDVFRAVNAYTLKSATPNREDLQYVVAKVFSAISTAVLFHQANLISFDGFLPKDLPEFERQIGRVSMIINMQCNEDVLLERLWRRGAREYDVSRQDRARVARYFKHTYLYAEELHALDAGRNIVKPLDASMSWEEVWYQLHYLVTEGLDVAGVQIRAAADYSNSAHMDDIFWQRLVHRIETSAE